MIGIQLDPVDTWFFRDGTPFSADSAPQEDVASLFPPHPSSVTGALRAALARSNGWNGRGRWPGRFNVVLGDGPDDLGALALDGPFLLRHGQPLFPAPRHLLGTTVRDRWMPRALLRPGADVTCDLGDAVRLPEASGDVTRIEDCKAGDGWWLTRAGMESVLYGKLPARNEFVSRQCLWSEEPRIGLERDRSTRTAEEGRLYSTRHIRVARGISLGARIAGIPEGWRLPIDQPVPLGGESRLAVCREWTTDLALDMPLAEVEASGRVAVVALTPIDLDREVCCGRQALDAPGNVRVVSACLSRPQRIGGWDSLARRPRPLRSVLPPGSVLFCETAEPRVFIEAITARDGHPRLGARQEWGGGLVATGIWPNESEMPS